MLKIIPIDNVWLRIVADEGICRELSEYFSFDVPGKQHIPAFKKRYWDGKIRLFKLKTGTIYRGLLPRILEFAEQRGYSVDNTVPDAHDHYVELEELTSVLEQFDLPDKIEEIHDYQIKAVRTCLNSERAVVLSPTGSGKSLIIYFLTQMIPDAKFLIIVPTIGLVTQMQKDFEFYNCAEPVHTITAGCAKNAKPRIFVSTWQSIYQEKEEYFRQFDGVIVDEVHLAKAKSLTSIMEMCDARYRFGFTGTLDGKEVHRLILEGLFGKVGKVTSTSALMEQNKLAQLRVKICVLEYPEQVRKSMRHTQYPDEIDFLVQHPPRNKFIVECVKNTKGNTLVLFQLVEKHGKPLYELIKAACPNKHVHYISGATEGDVREEIREAMSAGDGEHVLVASYGTTQLGINIPNLDTLITAAPAKSEVRVLQSIGRVLRMAEGKSKAVLIDIVDDLRIGKRENFVFKHAQERVNYYSTEKFKFTLHKFNLGSLTNV